MKVTASVNKLTRKPCFICDYSPPESGLIGSNALYPDVADYILVNSSPGFSVRASSSMVAAYIKGNAIADPIFTVVTLSLIHI